MNYLIYRKLFTFGSKRRKSKIFQMIVDEHQQTEPTSTDIEEKTKSIPAPDIKNTSAYS